MKVLFVSNYVDPYKNYNQNVVEQISYITKQNNINTEIIGILGDIKDTNRVRI